MDYHSMKRPELQRLCKKHQIPANSANSVLADKLSELLNVKQKPKGQQRTCIKSPIEPINESESAVTRRQSKKVRFSPEVEYERAGKKQKSTEPVITETKGRRKSVVKKVDEPSVDNVNDVQIPVKVTRSRAHIQVKDDVIPTNEKKVGRRGVKDVEKVTEDVKEPEGNVGKVTRSKATKTTVKEVEKESEPVKETIVATRATRSKGQTVTEESKDLDLIPQVKKKGGRNMKKDEVSKEVVNDVKNVPVRTTRSRVQSSNNDNVVVDLPIEKKRTRKDDSVVTNPPVEKKRTRRDTIVAEVSEIQDNAEKGTRQSRRNKANVEETTVVNQKEESVIERKVTRSKAVLEKKPSEEKGKGKSEVPNRRKSVIQPKIIEVVEEPVKAKKDTRRKSVVAKVKESKKPLVVKKEKVKLSPKVKKVGKKQTKEASESETKEVGSDSGSNKSRKRKGDSVIETEPVSTSKNSAKKEQVSVVKTPVSKKKAKLSGVKESESKENDTLETPIRKMANLELDDKDNETEKTPAIDESSIRSTRGAIKSDRKEPSKSAIKVETARKTPGRFTRSGIKNQESESGQESQPIEDAVMGTPITKMANLELNEKTPAVDVSGRRFTRGGIKTDRKEPNKSVIKAQTTGGKRKGPGRFTSGIKVDKMEQESESTHQSQPLEDADVGPPEDVEATIAVSSEVSKEASESVMLPTVDEVLDESHVQNQEGEESMIPEVSERNQDQEGEESVIPQVSERNQNQEGEESVIPEDSERNQNREGEESLIPEDSERNQNQEGEESAIPEVSERNQNQEGEEYVIPEVSEKETELTKLESTSDGSHLQNQNLEGEESVIPEVSEKETELTKSGPTSDVQNQNLEGEESVIPEVSEKETESEGLENDSRVEESFVSVVKTVEVIEENVEISLEQSDIKGKSKEDIEGASEFIADNGVNVQIDAAEDDVADKVDDLGLDSVNEGDDVDKKEIKDEKVTVKESSEPENDVVEVEKEPATVTENSEPEKVESDVAQSTENDVLEFPILGKSDEGGDSIKEHESITNLGDDKQEPTQHEDVAEVSNQSPDEEESEPSKDEDVPEASVKSPDEESEEHVVSLSVDEEVPYENVGTMEESEMDLMTSIEGLEKEKEDIETCVESKENEGVDLDLSNEQKTEEDDMADYSSHGVTQETQLIEESSPIENTKEEITDQLPGNLGAYGSPTTEEESPIDDTVSEPPTSFKNQDRNNQDWGNYNLGSDDFQKPVSVNESDDVEDQTTTDDQESSPNPTEEYVDWTDSSLKALLKTQTPGQASHVKDRQQSRVGFTLPDEDDETETPYPDSSMNRLFKTPATTQVSRVEYIQQQSRVRFAIPNEDVREVPDSCLKELLKTPATTLFSHVKEGEQSTVRFTLPDKDNTQNPYSSMKTHGYNTQVKAEPGPESSLKFPIPDDVFDQKQGLGRVMSFEDFSNKYFDHQQMDYASGDKDQVDQPQLSQTAPHDSSLKALFETPATSRMSHVKGKQQSAVGFDFPQDSLEKGSERGENPGVIEDPKSFTFEEFANKYFGNEDDDDDGSGKREM